MNGRCHSVNEIRSHLISDRIIPNYTKWIWHRELLDMPTVCRIYPVDEDIGDRKKTWFTILDKTLFQQAHTSLYEKIESDSRKPLYEGCTSFTRLSAVLALVNLKAGFGWSDKSFTKLLVLLKKMLHENNTLSKNQYKAKKILCPVGMEYQKIHACPNDCILYRNQFAEMHKWPSCRVSRYKVKDNECIDDVTTNNSLPAKVCWYLPLIPRFKRFFANQHVAKKPYMACKWQKKWWIALTSDWFSAMEDNWSFVYIFWGGTKKLKAWSCFRRNESFW